MKRRCYKYNNLQRSKIESGTPKSLELINSNEVPTKLRSNRRSMSLHDLTPSAIEESSIHYQNSSIATLGSRPKSRDSGLSRSASRLSLASTPAVEETPRNTNFQSETQLKINFLENALKEKEGQFNSLLAKHLTLVEEHSKLENIISQIRCDLYSGDKPLHHSLKLKKSFSWTTGSNSKEIMSLASEPCHSLNILEPNHSINTLEPSRLTNVSKKNTEEPTGTTKSCSFNSQSSSTITSSRISSLSKHDIKVTNPTKKESSSESKSILSEHGHSSKSSKIDIKMDEFPSQPTRSTSKIQTLTERCFEAKSPLTILNPRLRETFSKHSALKPSTSIASVWTLDKSMKLVSDTDSEGTKTVQDILGKGEDSNPTINASSLNHSNLQLELPEENFYNKVQRWQSEQSLAPSSNLKPSRLPKPSAPLNGSWLKCHKKSAPKPNLAFPMHHAMSTITAPLNSNFTLPTSPLAKYSHTNKVAQLFSPIPFYKVNPLNNDKKHLVEVKPGLEVPPLDLSGLDMDGSQSSHDVDISVDCETKKKCPGSGNIREVDEFLQIAESNRKLTRKLALKLDCKYSKGSKC